MPAEPIRPVEPQGTRLRREPWALICNAVGVKTNFNHEAEALKGPAWQSKFELRHLRLPGIDEFRDVFVTEIEVDQLAAEVHGAGQVARIGAADGQLVERL